MRRLLWLVMPVVVLVFSVVPAKADSITYTFTGAGFIDGTDFTYVSPSGFLSFVPSCCSGPFLTPTTATDFIANGIDSGPITGFSFANVGGDLLGFQVGTGSGFFGMMPFSLNVLGSQTLFGVAGNNLGTLDIASTPVPEPNTLILLGTGLLALGLLARRRLRVEQAVAKSLSHPHQNAAPNR